MHGVASGSAARDAHADARRSCSRAAAATAGWQALWQRPTPRRWRRAPPPPPPTATAARLRGGGRRGRGRRSGASRALPLALLVAPLDAAADVDSTPGEARSRRSCRATQAEPGFPRSSSRSSRRGRAAAAAAASREMATCCGGGDHVEAALAEQPRGGDRRGERDADGDRHDGRRPRRLGDAGRVLPSGEGRRRPIFGEEREERDEFERVSDFTGRQAGLQLWRALWSGPRAASQNPLRSGFLRSALLSLALAMALAAKARLLEAGDDGVSVFSHLTDVLASILDAGATPETALKSFEATSLAVKNAQFKPSDGVPKAPVRLPEPPKSTAWHQANSTLLKAGEEEKGDPRASVMEEMKFFEGAGVGFSAEESLRLYASLCKLTTAKGSRARASSAGPRLGRRLLRRRGQVRGSPSRRGARAPRRGGGRRHQRVLVPRVDRPHLGRVGCAAERDAGADRRGGRDPQDGDGRPRRRRPLLPTFPGKSAVPPRDDARIVHDTRSSPPASTPARRTRTRCLRRGTPPKPYELLEPAAWRPAHRVAAHRPHDQPPAERAATTTRRSRRAAARGAAQQARAARRRRVGPPAQRRDGRQRRRARALAEMAGRRRRRRPEGGQVRQLLRRTASAPRRPLRAAAPPPVSDDFSRSRRTRRSRRMWRTRRRWRRS